MSYRGERTIERAESHGKLVPTRDSELAGVARQRPALCRLLPRVGRLGKLRHDAESDLTALGKQLVRSCARCVLPVREQRKRVGWGTG